MKMKVVEAKSGEGIVPSTVVLVCDVHTARRFYRAIGKTVDVTIEGDEAEVDMSSIPEVPQ